MIRQPVAHLRRQLDRRAAGRLLRSPYALAPHPADEISPPAASISALSVWAFIDMTLLRFSHAYTADLTLPAAPISSSRSV